MIIQRFAFGGLALSLAVVTASGQESSGYFDDFQGQDLSPAFRILNPDKQRMALVEGEYLLLVTHSDTKNVIQYTQPLPDHYSVTLRVASPPLHNRQLVRIRIGDSANNVRIGALIDTFGSKPHGPIFSSNKTIADESASAISQVASEAYGEPFYLRSERKGVEYIHSYSLDGSRWVTVGSQVLIAPEVQIHIEVSNWGEAPETPVKLDSFEIVAPLH